MPTFQVDELGLTVTYTYDADGHCIRVQRGENKPDDRQPKGDR